MNFKTTIVLLVLLLGAGAAVYFARSSGDDATPATDKPTGKMLLSINAADVQTLAVTPASGKKLVVNREGMGWKMSDPVSAAAEAPAINALLGDLTALEIASADVDITESSGIHSPRFVVDLTTKDGKTTTLNIGDRSGVGERMYVQVKGNPKADLVAAGVDEQLEKPVEDFRDRKLVQLTAEQVKHIVIERPGSKLELIKDGNAWRIGGPEGMEADGSTVSEILFSATGMRAVEFADGPATSPMYGLGPDARKVTLSAAAPTAQPTTQSTTSPATQPATVTLAFGRADTVLQQNVYATVVGTNAVVKVAKSATNFLDRKPLEVRNRQVLDLDPASVNKLTVTINQPATTQPTTKPAEMKTLTVTRRQAPATQPTTQPSTQPVPSTWITDKGDSNDSAVEAILSALNPLKAEKFLDSPPADGKTITVTVQTGGGGVRVAGGTEVRFIIPAGGHDAPVGAYNGLNFEVEPSLIDTLEADFAKPGPPMPEMPAMPPMGPMQ